MGAVAHDRIDGAEQLRAWIAEEPMRTQKWLADVLGVQTSTVNSWICKRTMPSVEHVVGIHHLAGIQVESWLTDTALELMFELRARAEEAMRKRVREHHDKKIDPRQVPLLPDALNESHTVKRVEPAMPVDGEDMP